MPRRREGLRVRVGRQGSTVGCDESLKHGGLINEDLRFKQVKKSSRSSRLGSGNENKEVPACSSKFPVCDENSKPQTQQRLQILCQRNGAPSTKPLPFKIFCDEAPPLPGVSNSGSSASETSVSAACEDRLSHVLDHRLTANLRIAHNDESFVSDDDRIYSASPSRQLEILRMPPCDESKKKSKKSDHVRLSMGHGVRANKVDHIDKENACVQKFKKSRIDENAQQERAPFRTRPPEPLTVPPTDPVKFALSFSSGASEEEDEEEVATTSSSPADDAVEPMETGAPPRSAFLAKDGSGLPCGEESPIITCNAVRRDVIANADPAKERSPSKSRRQESAVESVVSSEDDLWFFSASSHFPSDYAVPLSETERQLRDEALYGCPEFAPDIYQYMRHREDKHRLKPNFLDRQAELTEEMRAILVDWLCEVTLEYRLSPETFFLAVHLVDRFLSLKLVTKPRLQLVGITAMYIAAKIEQVYPPSVNEMSYITDDTYSVAQILKTERAVLQALDYNTSLPTVFHFLSLFHKLAKTRSKTRYLSFYLAELASLDVEFARFLPSVQAAGALCLANIMTGEVPWSEEIERDSGYAVSVFHECMNLMLFAFKHAPISEQKAIREKYESDENTLMISN